MTNVASLAIIAGGGAFPGMIAQHMRDKGAHVFVVTLHGSGEPIAGFDGITARPEQLKHIFRELRVRGIRDLVLIGRMKRPRIFDLRPDLMTLKLIPRILYELCFGGDDALLKSVRRMLEQQGFALHAAQEFLDGLIVTAGPLGQYQPGEGDLRDIRIGMGEARNLGRRDVGQAVIVAGGHVIGRENIQGTDALIRTAGVRGAILVKAAKPQQDRALDLPTIGPDTVRLCVEAGFKGIAVEAGATLMADKDATISLADTGGLFLMGIQ
jgi:DUF1009 family protein